LSKLHIKMLLHMLGNGIVKPNRVTGNMGHKAGSNVDPTPITGVFLMQR
jgi:hypothetical protein